MNMINNRSMDPQHGVTYEIFDFPDPELAGLETLLERGINVTEFFSNQFILTPHELAPHFASWRCLTTQNWSLQVGPDMPAGYLLDIHGTVIGYFIGIGVDGQGHCVSGRTVLSIDSKATSFLGEIETYFANMAGRFLAVIDTDWIQRIYVDPIGDMGMVYDPVGRRIASTLLLALNRNIKENSVIPYEKVLSGAIYHVLGQTRDAHAKRMLPNHFLDLKSFELYRHWPKEDTNLNQGSLTPERLLYRIIEKLTSNVDALTRGQNCILPVSSGRDSRNLIGCARDIIDRFELGFTHSYDHQYRQYGYKRHKIGSAKSSALIASEIARKVGLPHNILCTAPTEDEIELYPYRTGFVPNRSNSLVMDSVNSLPKGRVALMGNVMELLRANQWRKYPIGSKTSLRHALYFRLNYKQHKDEDVAQLHKDWRVPLLKKYRPHLYEIQFLEHILPNTLGAKHYGTNNVFYMNPFADRSIIENCLRLPLEYRRSGQANTDFLNVVSPDLADIDFI